MAPKKRLETADGFEMQFGTNVLGHFALTMRLMPALSGRAEPGAKAAGSNGGVDRAQAGTAELRRSAIGKSYSPMGAYRQSKLADLMFSFELARRLKDAGRRRGA